MYESYYGFAEKPFSLTPDPKFLYRSPSHGDAFDLLQYAIGRREGFVVITGDIGVGKTTICRALLEQIDRATFTALVLNPFLSEEDLLKRILQDFGVVAREDVKAGRLQGVTKQELLDALYDFLLGLIPLKAHAVLIIDEAQNLPLPLLEQIRMLSNLETDKEKLLQIVLVGQLDLQALLRSPELRQLDQRVSIRYELKPLDREAVGAYVAHRLAVAGGSASVTFTTAALDQVHRLSGGLPRLINLICDRALLAGFSAQASRITPEMVLYAAKSLDVRASTPAARRGWLARPRPLSAAAATVLLSVALGVGASAYLYQRFADASVEAAARQPDRLVRAVDSVRADATALPPLPSGATHAILVGSFSSAASGPFESRAMTEWLGTFGLTVYDGGVDPSNGWRRVLAGAYTDRDSAQRDADRLNAASPTLGAQVVGTTIDAGRAVTQP
jgi:type II secretory pathway predicted ATPase ExeA